MLVAAGAAGRARLRPQPVRARAAGVPTRWCPHVHSVPTHHCLHSPLPPLTTASTHCAHRGPLRGAVSRARPARQAAERRRGGGARPAQPAGGHPHRHARAARARRPRRRGAVAVRRGELAHDRGGRARDAAAAQHAAVGGGGHRHEHVPAVQLCTTASGARLFSSSLTEFDLDNLICHSCDPNCEARRTA